MTIEYRSAARVGEAISWEINGDIREGTVIGYNQWDEGNRVGALLMTCQDAETADQVWSCPVSSPYWWFCSRPVPEGDLEGILAMLRSVGGEVDMDEVRRIYRREGV